MKSRTSYRGTAQRAKLLTKSARRSFWVVPDEHVESVERHSLNLTALALQQ